MCPFSPGPKTLPFRGDWVGVLQRIGVKPYAQRNRSGQCGSRCLTQISLSSELTLGQGICFDTGSVPHTAICREGDDIPTALRRSLGVEVLVLGLKPKYAAIESSLDASEAVIKSRRSPSDINMGVPEQ